MVIRIHLLRSADPRGDDAASSRSTTNGALRSVPGGLLGRALAVVAGGLLLVAGLFVSAVVFSVLLVAGIAVGGWFWWKTRDFRRELAARVAQMQQMQTGPRPGMAERSSPGVVLDGDFIRESVRPEESDRGGAGQRSGPNRPGERTV